MTERRTRKEMLTEVIRMFGHEAPETIDFAKKCESYPDNNLSLDRLEMEYRGAIIKKIILTS